MLTIGLHVINLLWLKVRIKVTVKHPPLVKY